MSIQKTPQGGTILFKWFNQYSGILLKTPSKTLVFDPVEIKPKTLHNIDAVLITHEHYDHLNPSTVEEIQKENNCLVIADWTSTRKLQKHIPKDKLVMTKQGDTHRIGEVTVKVEKANHPALSPVTYRVTSEDNVKVYHTADSLPFAEMEKLASDEKFDIAFCTVGVAPGCTPETGVEIARLLQPFIAIPYHGTAQNQKDFATLLKKMLPKTACLIPEQNKIYKVTKRKDV